MDIVKLPFKKASPVDPLLPSLSEYLFLNLTVFKRFLPIWWMKKVTHYFSLYFPFLYFLLPFFLFFSLSISINVFEHIIDISNVIIKDETHTHIVSINMYILLWLAFEKHSLCDTPNCPCTVLSLCLLQISSDTSSSLLWWWHIPDGLVKSASSCH